MKVILLNDLRGSGKKGDVIKVSDGYAKNFLFPKNLAKEANAKNLSELESQRATGAYKKELEKQDAYKIAKTLKDGSITITAKAGEGGKIFGSVTSKEIACKINEIYNIEVDKRKICLKEDIKTFGTYGFEIKVYPEVSVNMFLRVVGE